MTTTWPSAGVASTRDVDRVAARRRSRRSARGRRRGRSAASATASGSSARGLSRSAAHQARRVDARRARRASRAAPSRGAARRRACAAESANSSASAARNACAPATFLRAVEQHQRLVADDLEPTRRLHVARTRRRRARRRARRRGSDSAAVERDRRVVGLVRAVQREEDLVVASASGVYRSSTRPPSRESVATGPRSRGRARTTAPGSRARKIRHQRRDRSPRAPASRPAPRCRPSPPRSRPASGPRYSTWSMLTLVTTATVGLDHVGGVPGAAEADLDHRDVDRDVAEPVEGGGGQDLEVARARRAGTPRPRRPRVRSSASSSSSIGSPFQAIRSLTRARCGLVYEPVDSPAASSSAAIIRAADVLPLVPVRCTAGILELGRAEQLGQRRGSRSSVEQALRRSPPARGRRRRSRGSRGRRATPARRSGRRVTRCHSGVASVDVDGELRRPRPARASPTIRPASRTSATRGLERGEPLGRCRATVARDDVGAHRPLGLGLRLADLAEHRGRRRVHGRVGRTRRRRASSAAGHGGAVDRAVLPPRPHLFGHVTAGAARTGAAAWRARTRSAAREPRRRPTVPYARCFTSSR